MKHAGAQALMDSPHVFFDMAAVISAAALLSWLSLMFRQPVILGYILCGVLVGPWGFSVVQDVQFVDEVGRVGVTLLLFLAGLVLHPQKLTQLFRETVLVTLINCVILFVFGAGMARIFDFNVQESVITGLACMFSSTILVVKLLPTTALHQQRMGAVCIAILIGQDLLAVTSLLFIAGWGNGVVSFALWLPVKAAALVAVALLVEKHALRRMLRASDHFHETLYLLTIGWCLAVAMAAEWLGLSQEVGAFVAGVAMARSPVSRFLSEGLKPLRDFFLVLFFFALGARLNLQVFPSVLLPAAALATFMMVAKPAVTYALLLRAGETDAFAREAGVRLGQASEFSLILALAAEDHGLIGVRTAQMIQVAAFLTLIASSYWMVLRLPTPLGRGRLQRV